MVTDPLAYLFGLEHFGIKFGLENIAALVDALGHPERAFRSIHIAGTNGKGSVTAIIDAALRSAGCRSARYTSPHLVDLNERFVIDGHPIATAALAAAISEVRERIEALHAAGTLQVQPTFFEVTTAVAFELFRRSGVDVATLEVGLGGRLDATNVVVPIATAITSISFDHQQYLGRTIREIAIEKAGIIKPGVPVVVGQLTPEAAAAIESVAHARGAELVRAWEGIAVERIGPEAGSVRPEPDITVGPKADTTDEKTVLRLRTPAHDYGEIVVALRGAHQVANAVVAVRVLELLGPHGLTVPPWAIADALAHVSWPGRLDLRRLPDGREVLLDAAHNAAGAAALASYLRQLGGTGLPLVFSAMRDKDVVEMFRALLPMVASVVLTRASNPRAADPVGLAVHARAVAPRMQMSVEPAPRDALAAAWRGSRRIVVAGSIFLVGDVLQEIERS